VVGVVYNGCFLVHADWVGNRYHCPDTQVAMHHPHITSAPFMHCILNLQVCTQQLGMCTANTTSSQPCLACKAGLAQMVGSFESQRDYYRRYGSGASWAGKWAGHKAGLILKRGPSSPAFAVLLHPCSPAVYSYMSLEEMALSACVSAVGRLNSTRNTCEALAAMDLKASTQADAAAACAANASVLCQVGGSAAPAEAGWGEGLVVQQTKFMFARALGT